MDFRRRQHPAVDADLVQRAKEGIVRPAAHVLAQQDIARRLRHEHPEICRQHIAAVVVQHRHPRVRAVRQRHMLEHIRLQQPARRNQLMIAVRRVHQVRIQAPVGGDQLAGAVTVRRHRIREGNPQLHPVRLDLVHFHHPVELVGGRARRIRRPVKPVVIRQHPQVGRIIRAPQNGREIPRVVRVIRLACQPVREIIRLAALPAERTRRRRIRQPDPQIPVHPAIRRELVIDPVLVVRRPHRRQMAAQLLRPIFRDGIIRVAQQVIIMAVVRAQEWPRLHRQIRHRRVRRHPGQPFHQRLPEREVRRIEPPFHRETRARPHIQRRGLHQHIRARPVRARQRVRIRQRRLRNLHIRIRPRKDKDLPRIHHPERLAHLARRECEPSHQPPVVRVVLRIRTVQRIPLPAPPAVDPRSAVPVSHIVRVARQRRQRARDHPVRQRQVIAPRLQRHRRIAQHAHLVVRERHIVRERHQVAVRQPVAHHHQIRRHRPAAVRIVNIRRPRIGPVRQHIRPVRHQVQITEGVIRPLAVQLVRRDGILDWHRRQIRVIRERQIRVIRHLRPHRIRPLIPVRIRIAELVHDDRQIGRIDRRRPRRRIRHRNRYRILPRIVRHARIPNQVRRREIRPVVDRHLVRGRVEIIRQRNRARRVARVEIIRVRRRPARRRRVQHVRIDKHRARPVRIQPAPVLHQQNPLARQLVHQRDRQVRDADVLDHHPHARRRDLLRARHENAVVVHHVRRYPGRRRARSRDIFHHRHRNQLVGKEHILRHRARII